MEDLMEPWLKEVWDLSRGSLPKDDPIENLPKYFSPWEELAREMPKLLASGNFGKQVKNLPLLDADRLIGVENEVAMRPLSFAVQGEVFENWRTKPKTSISPQLAIPLVKVAKKVGRPPIMSYPSYMLYNWKRLDKSKGVLLGNIKLIQVFLGGMDEEWFILDHGEIHFKAIEIVCNAYPAQGAAKAKDVEILSIGLELMGRALGEMYKTLLRMTENCDPYIYFSRVRPYIHGWKDHPALPEGVVYEGVPEFGRKPQRLRGESGAQGMDIPLCDALFGIKHKRDKFTKLLLDMRNYMPPPHREFLEARERDDRGSYSIRKFVLANKRKESRLLGLYNDCVDGVAAFRELHLKYTYGFIAKQAEKSLYNPHATGTGGTPFVIYLQKHLDETRAHIIK